MKRYRITVGNRTFDIRVLTDPRQQQVEVEVDGELLTVEVETVPSAPEATGMDAEQVATPAPALSAVAASANRTVDAPLPGVIKSISVQPGQQVSLDEVLVIIEAMKMDNVIRAQRAGTIGTIYVTEGHQVAHGEPLLDYSE